MKINARFFAFMFVALAVFCITLACGTVTTFKTGPFSVSVDLGIPCNDTNISKTAQSEWLNGNRYIDYNTSACGVSIFLTTTDNANNDVNNDFDTGITKNDLLKLGADKETINVSERKINGWPGAFGSGYVSKYGSTIYEADFYVNPKTVGHILLDNNETEIVSALKTIHVTEAG
jgi:hypothetical protein